MPEPRLSLELPRFEHPRFERRTLLQAGAIGLLGLGSHHLEALADDDRATAKSAIFIFLSGGLAQHESFDPKPDAPEMVRGEFAPIATRTPGVHVCEHLPRLAQLSPLWSLCRSLTHPYNEHSQGHMVMLSGRTPMPPGFDPNKPTSTDWPSMAAIANVAARPRHNLPPAIVLPEILIHRTGRVIPGQLAGEMGRMRDPWVVQASPFHPQTYGAYPEFEFEHEHGKRTTSSLSFEAPSLSIPEGLSRRRFDGRFGLLDLIERQRVAWDKVAALADFDRHRQRAVSLLADPKLKHAFDVRRAPDEVQERYGRNQFGWSLLMARRLVSAGVRLVQVNLGNNETWDTHQAAFRNLKEFLLPPMDRAVSALLTDLQERGELDRTLIVMAGEFGRTPKISTIPGAKLAGRDHWGAVQSVLLAGGGVRGGTILGASDKHGGYPAAAPQTPENLAATIYSALGIPRHLDWYDATGRPHAIYHGDPMEGLL